MTDRHEDDTKKVPAQPQEVPMLEDFKGVLGWVEKKKEQSKAEGKPWGWVMGLIAAVVVFIALAFAAYTAWKKGREIAKLKHKIDVDEELKEQTKADHKIQIHAEERAKLALKIIRLKRQIEDTKLHIKELEWARKETHSKIDKITSWEDVDSL